MFEYVVRVDNESSERLQKAALNAGYTWPHNSRIIKNTGQEYLWFNPGILQISYSNELTQEDFANEDVQLVTQQGMLNILTGYGIDIYLPNETWTVNSCMQSFMESLK